VGLSLFVRCEVVTVVNPSHLCENQDLLDVVADFCAERSLPEWEALFGLSSDNSSDRVPF